MLDDPSKTVEVADGLIPVADEQQAAITNGEATTNKSESSGDKANKLAASNGDTAKPKTKANKKKDWASYPNLFSFSFYFLLTYIFGGCI